jgi:2,3-bisphosphoglycerate-dependent phosphoglycerate mutase
MAIFLIRHGETSYNAARMLQLPDAGLSPRGLEQAERLARRLAGEGIARILSSDLRRAVQTAELLQSATGADLQLSSLLRERDFGEIRGLAYDALGVDIFAREFDPPGGETWEEFENRADAAWREVTRAASTISGHLAVVTHGMMTYTFALRHLKLSEDVPPLMEWANTSVTMIDPQPPWQVRLLNCTAHLEALP